MRTIAESYKPFQLITPQLATATVTGSGVLMTPGEEFDAIALVSVGAIAGTPDTTSCIVTIEASATSGGTYAAIATFAAATSATQLGSKQVLLTPVSKPYVRAVATIAFTGGTTPSIAIAVDLLVRQTVKSTSVAVALA